MLAVAAAILTLLSGHGAPSASLSVDPLDFSPWVGTLSVSARLPAPRRVGVRLVTSSGKVVGWLDPPKRATGIELSWNGELDGERVPDGDYVLQLVAGGHAIARAALRIDARAPSLIDFRAKNGGDPFAGDDPMLTTITPNGDGLRDRASIDFTLSEPASVSIEVERTARRRTVVETGTFDWGTGRHTFVWAPPATTAGQTYLVRLEATDAAHNTRSYGARTAYTSRFSPGPVVRVLGVDASFTEESYAPGQPALLRVATDAPAFTMQFFRVGGEARPSYLQSEMSGLPVTGPTKIAWLSHLDGPATIRLRIGAWESGVYYAELATENGRVGYAPFVVRPSVLGAAERVAVVMPTSTWQAYNFYDVDGDGWGDTWYAGRDDLTVALDRPFVNRGVPPRFQRYETPFLNWMAQEHLSADFLSQADLDRIRTGQELAAGYNLVVFPTHTEYVTDHEYDLIRQYRDAGGNLAFLSANNFFRRVVKRAGVLTRTELERDVGRPEASLLGVQYRANDDGARQGVYVLRNTAAVPWLWKDTGLVDGSTLGDAVGGYGIEIDETTADSPAGTIVLGAVPDLFGPGVPAEMTYYETPVGAKVFAAGTLDFVGSALTWPVRRMLVNLWNRLSRP